VSSYSGHVLFAEDNEDLRDSLVDGLSWIGFRVSGFEDGAALLEALRTAEPPFVVLTDLLMPRCSGYTVLDQLEHAGLLEVIPVLVLTAVPHPELEQATLVIAKPIDLGELATFIDVQMRFAEEQKDAARQRLATIAK
jgi:CheY-like chemotaxis protein